MFSLPKRQKYTCAFRSVTQSVYYLHKSSVEVVVGYCHSNFVLQVL